MTRDLSSVALKTKAIRKELKEKFPGHKFSVTCKNFSMGSSFNVKWIDGPIVSEVKEITDKYAHVRRCEYSGEILGGGNTYDSIERSYSPKVMQPELDRIVKEYNVTTWRGERVTEIGTRINSDGSMSMTDHYTIDGHNGRTVGSLLSETIAKTSYYQAPEKTTKKAKADRFVNRPIEDQEVIIDYLFPENAIATDCGATVTENEEKNGVEIRFDRKPDSAVLDTLKGNGFRYSRHQGIWYAKRSTETLTIAHNIAKISAHSIPVVEQARQDFSYLLRAANEQLAQEVAEVKAELSELPALPPAIEPEIIEVEIVANPDLSVEEFRQAASSGKVISLSAFAIAIGRESNATKPPALKPTYRKPTYRVIDTFAVDSVSIVLPSPKPVFKIVRDCAPSGLVAWK